MAGNCAKELGDIVAFLFWQFVGKNLVTLLWLFFALANCIKQFGDFVVLFLFVAGNCVKKNGGLWLFLFCFETVNKQNKNQQTKQNKLLDANNLSAKANFCSQELASSNV